MGEKIEFPKNYEIYMKLAEKYSNQNELPQALEAIEKAYEIERTFEANLLYVSILIQAEQYTTAYDMTVDFETHYLTEPSYASIFLFILLRRGQIEAAEALIQSHEQEKTLANMELQNMKEQVEEARLEKERNAERTKEELIRKVYAIADYPLSDQLSIIEEMGTLPHLEMKGINTVILDNPFVTKYVKALFLQVLIRVQYPYEIEMTIFNDKVRFVPASLVEFNLDHLVETLNLELETVLEKEPSLLLMIQPELNSHLLIIYPLIHSVITEVDYWLSLYLSHFGKETTKVEETSESRMKMRNCFSQLIDENT